MFFASNSKRTARLAETLCHGLLGPRTARSFTSETCARLKREFLEVAMGNAHVKLVAVSPTIVRGVDVSPRVPVFDLVLGCHSSRPLTAFDAMQQYGRVRACAVRPGPAGAPQRVLFTPDEGGASSSTPPRDSPSPGIISAADSGESSDEGEGPTREIDAAASASAERPDVPAPPFQERAAGSPPGGSDGGDG